MMMNADDDDDDDDDVDDDFHSTPASALPRATAIAEASMAGGRTAETRVPFYDCIWQGRTEFYHW